MAVDVVIGTTVGVAVGIVLAIIAFLCIRLRQKRDYNIQQHARNGSSLPIHMNDFDASIASTASVGNSEILLHVHPQKENKLWFGWRQHAEDLTTSASGIPRYPYRYKEKNSTNDFDIRVHFFSRDIQKATDNFTTVLGQGSFGPVYKATMSSGAVVAIKVLASDSKQGDREFHTEVALLSRLHHRNLVNLVGYCVEKGKRMLIYEFMSNGSLESHLYGERPRVLTWKERLQIVHDVSHGIEYLHEGAVPPVIHRDLKPANILLDQYMRAKVADFGLSKEEVRDGRKSGLKGTYGYMDPDYMTTSRFTKKSDIYSFGLIMFELITAINPHQGLTEYINLAAIGGEGNADWEEILDKKLVGNCDLTAVRVLANVAFKCLHKNPTKRPTIKDIILAISRIEQRQMTREDSVLFPGRETKLALQMIEEQQLELRSKTISKVLESQQSEVANGDTEV